VLLVGYLAWSWGWLYTSERPLEVRVVYWGTLVFLLVIGGIHFATARVLRGGVLIDCNATAPRYLSGFEGRPSIELRGKVRTWKAAPQLAGTAGLAYFVHLQGRWYLAVGPAAQAVQTYMATGKVQ
jgi:hypothetical protein